MPAGHQTAQVAHAIADFAFKKPDEFQEWHKKSQYVVVLQTKTQEALCALRAQAQERNLSSVAFHEPDLDDELTALAFPPHPGNKAFLSNLPLAGKNLPSSR